MNKLTLTAMGCFMMVASVNAAAAQDHKVVHQRTVVVEKDVVVRPAPRPVQRRVIDRIVDERLDKVHRDIRIVDRRLDRLPPDHVRIVHDGRSYFMFDGAYYVRRDRDYVLVNPVRGLRLARLPVGYTTVVVNGETRYRFRGIDYRRVDGVYIVV